MQCSFHEGFLVIPGFLFPPPILAVAITGLERDNEMNKSIEKETADTWLVDLVRFWDTPKKARFPLILVTSKQANFLTTSSHQFLP